MEYIYVLGFVLLLYGSIKLIVGVIGLTFNKKQREELQKYKIIGDFVPKDSSIAAKVLDFSIVIFAIYSIFRGIYLLRIYDHDSFKTTMESRQLAYILYGFMGAFLIIFYYIVVYTSNNIEKDPDETATYKLIGIGTGIFFLIILTCMYVVHNYKTLGVIQYVAVCLSMIALISGMTYIVNENIDRVKQRKNEIVTILMIPLAAV